MIQPVKIAVVPTEVFSRHQQLFAVLGELYSLQFEPRAEAPEKDFAATLLFGASRTDALRIASAGMRCLAYLKDEPIAVKTETAALSLAAIPYLDQSFRGRTLPDRSITQARPLRAEAGDEIVARKGDDLLWIHRRVGQTAVDWLALDPPVLGANEYLYPYIQRDNCLRLLPLVHFLRAFSPWKRPPLRGCLMFDDPNLHWKTYGCVRYEELAQHAHTHNYHASFATVPFDGWYVHPPTAALFRKHRSRLSLLVHGNNHTQAELAQPYANGVRQALMAQALRRISEMEKRSGLEIPRVMAAPHGGCSAEMADAMLQVGFEAATISRWSLMHYNRNPWHPAIGLNIAEFLGTAFPIIPRFKLAHEREVDVYLAALLEKPIILVGHHDDVSQGLGILEQFAHRINSVGQVNWLDMQAMSRSNFCTHQAGNVLQVKLYSRRVRITIPPQVNNLIVHRAWLKAEASEALQWRVGTTAATRIEAYRAEAIPVTPGAEIEVASLFAGAVDPQTVAPPRTSFWAGVRRGFCEVRDRARPFTEQLKRAKAGAKRSV